MSSSVLRRNIRTFLLGPGEVHSLSDSTERDLRKQARKAVEDKGAAGGERGEKEQGMFPPGSVSAHEIWTDAFGDRKPKHYEVTFAFKQFTGVAFATGAHVPPHKVKKVGCAEFAYSDGEVCPPLTKLTVHNFHRYLWLETEAPLVNDDGSLMTESEVADLKREQGDWAVEWDASDAGKSGRWFGVTDTLVKRVRFVR